MKKRGMLPIDIYKPLKINRINFYRAIKTSNFKNKTFKKIIAFLDLELNIKLKAKKMRIKKSKIYKKIFWVEDKAVLKMIDENLVMCGTKNWEHYYSKIGKLKK